MHVCVRMTELYLWAKISSLLIFVNEVLLKHSHAHLITYCLWLYDTLGLEQHSQKDFRAQKTDNICHLTLHRKLGKPIVSLQWAVSVSSPDSHLFLLCQWQFPWALSFWEAGAWRLMREVKGNGRQSSWTGCVLSQDSAASLLTLLSVSLKKAVGQLLVLGGLQF